MIILDPSLKDMGGHYYEYDAAIAAAALHKGRYTWIYANKSCSTELVIPGGEIYPWFTTEWSAAGGRTKIAMRRLVNILPAALGALLAKLGRLVWNFKKKQIQRTINYKAGTISAAANAFGEEVVRALDHAGCSGDDIIFVPTIRTSELFALWMAIKNASDLAPLKFHVVLRRDAAEMDLPEGGAPGISSLFSELQAALIGNPFRFYCDTQQLCDDYATLSAHRLEFRILPIPFPNVHHDPISLEKWRAGSAIKLVYLGGARTEKGFHLLSHAEHTLRKKYVGKLLWRLQAPLSSLLEEPEVTAARRHLSSVCDGSVDLLERNLSSEEFQSLLLSADIVLLPYLPEFYRARSSGILVQVLAAGKPVIVPAGSWLSNQTDGKGVVEFEKISGLSDAVLQAAQQLERLTAEAQSRAAAYAAFHSADTLVGALESGGRSGQGNRQMPSET